MSKQLGIGLPGDEMNLAGATGFRGIDHLNQGSFSSSFQENHELRDVAA